MTTRLSRGMPRGRRHAVARRVRLDSCGREGDAQQCGPDRSGGSAGKAVRADVDALMSGLYALGILWQRACT